MSTPLHVTIESGSDPRLFSNSYAAPLKIYVKDTLVFDSETVAPSAAELHHVTLTRSPKEQSEIESGIHAEPNCSPDPPRSAAERTFKTSGTQCEVCGYALIDHRDMIYCPVERSEQPSSAKATNDKQEWEYVPHKVNVGRASCGHIEANGKNISGLIEGESVGKAIVDAHNAALAAERQDYDKLHAKAVHWQDTALSALAAISLAIDELGKGYFDRTIAVKILQSIDLSLLHQHNAEVRKPLVKIVKQFRAYLKKEFSKHGATVSVSEIDAALAQCKSL